MNGYDVSLVLEGTMLTMTQMGGCDPGGSNKRPPSVATSIGASMSWAGNVWGSGAEATLENRHRLLARMPDV